MAKITITITASEKGFIESMSAGTAEEVVNKVFSDWLDNQVTLKYEAKSRQTKTRDEKITELTT